jgi:hypothetical protein
MRTARAARARGDALADSPARGKREFVKKIPVDMFGYFRTTPERA